MDEDNPKLPPLRPFDDFLIGGARFGPPDFKNQEKWNNRVAQNLMYYQSNYFLMLAVIFLLALYLQPGAMIYGIFLFSLASAYFYFVFIMRMSEMRRFQHDHPIGYVAVVIFSCVAILYIIPRMAFFLLSLLLPVLLMFVHSSFRMRNFNNKIQNRMECAGLKKTLMGQIIKAIFQDF